MGGRARGPAVGSPYVRRETADIKCVYYPYFTLRCVWNRYVLHTYYRV